MPKLVYVARPEDVLLEDGQEIHGGEVFEATATRAKQLKESPELKVRDAKDDEAKDGDGDQASSSPKAGASS